MKRFTAFYLFILLLALFVLALPGITKHAHASYNYRIDVYVNSHQVAFPDQKPFIDTGANRTYVPLRFVSEALGAEVNWDGAKQTAVVVRGGKTVNMQIGSTEPTVDGKATTIDAPAILMNGRTVVPLRFVSEVLGAQVKWEAPVGGGNGKVLIIDPTAPAKPPSVNPDSGKPADVTRLENIHGVTMTTNDVGNRWGYEPTRDIINANKDHAYLKLSYNDGTVRVAVAWASILPDIRHVQVDLSPLEKTLESYFPGHSKNPEIMAKAREMADIRRESNGFRRHDPVNYNLNDRRVLLQSGDNNLVSLAIIAEGR